MKNGAYILTIEYYQYELLSTHLKKITLANAFLSKKDLIEIYDILENLINNLDNKKEVK